MIWEALIKRRMRVASPGEAWAVVTSEEARWAVVILVGAATSAEETLVVGISAEIWEILEATWAAETSEEIWVISVATWAVR